MAQKKDEKKFQAWVKELDVKRLEKAIEGKYSTKREWLEHMIDLTSKGLINQEEKKQEGSFLSDDKKKLIEKSCEKLGIEFENFLDEKINELIIESKKTTETKTKTSGETKLVEARLESGLSQSEIAKMIDVDRSTYHNIESGKRTGTVEILIKISDILNISIKDIVNSQKEMRAKIQQKN